MQDREQFKSRVMGAMAAHGMTDVPESIVDESIDLMNDIATGLEAERLLGEAHGIHDSEAWQRFNDDDVVIRVWSIVAPESAAFDDATIRAVKVMTAVAFAWLQRQDPSYEARP